MIFSDSFLSSFPAALRTTTHLTVKRLKKMIVGHWTQK